MTGPSAPDGRSLAGLAVYTMFGGDPRQLLEWCNVHLAAGADQLYVYLDRPSPALVAALPAHEQVRWEPVDATTWDVHYPPGARNVERKQVDGFRLAARTAAADGHRYLAFVDADELLDLSRPFAEVAAEAPEAVALRLPVREMWYDAPERVTAPFGATLAVGRPSSGRLDWSRVLGWRAQFLRNGVLGHHAGKSVYRLPLAVADLTVHGPRTLPGAPVVDVPEETGRVLHFDSGSIDTWTAKWGGRLGGGTVAAGLGPHRRAQQRLFEHALRMPGAQRREFFEDFYVLDEPAREALEERGLVRRVDVSGLTTGPLPTAVPDEVVPAPPVVPGLPHERVDFQFALVCDQRFVKPTFATMTSVLAQVGDKGSVRFVVLGDGIDGADVSRLRALEHTRFDVEVVVHDITADLDRDVGTEDAKRATFGRIYLIDHLPPQRTVYLDGDVLATRDFTELFDRDLGGACLAGVPDSAALRLVANPANVPLEQRNRLVGITRGNPLEYLNGGVLVFDLDNPDFRALALRARALVVLQGRALKQRDQDAMNIAFAGRKHRLESTYNYMTQFYASDRVLDGDLTRLKYDAADASLIHFSGRIKPWESPDDEFYNGLYRKLVLEAERKVGVSCEFYFSDPPSAPRSSWTADRWAEVLGATTPGRGAAGGTVATDVSVVDVSDAGVYLTLSAEMLEHARTHELRLVGRTADAVVLDAPLPAAGPVLNHLATRVRPGTRLLALDLAGALASSAGVVRHLELGLAAPSGHGFVRPLGVLDLVAAGAAASPDLLAELGADGALQAVEDGWLTGWYRAPATARDAAVTVHVDGRLAARRAEGARRDDLLDDGRTWGFRFHLERLVALGDGPQPAVSVRIAGTNVPLRGGVVRVADPRRDLRYDPEQDAWVEPAAPRRPAGSRSRVPALERLRQARFRR